MRDEQKSLAVSFLREILSGCDKKLMFTTVLKTMFTTVLPYLPCRTFDAEVIPLLFS